MQVGQSRNVAKKRQAKAKRLQALANNVISLTPAELSAVAAAASQGIGRKRGRSSAHADNGLAVTDVREQQQQTESIAAQQRQQQAANADKVSQADIAPKTADKALLAGGGSSVGHHGGTPDGKKRSRKNKFKEDSAAQHADKAALPVDVAGQQSAQLAQTGSAPHETPVSKAQHGNALKQLKQCSHTQPLPASTDDAAVDCSAAHPAASSTKQHKGGAASSSKLSKMRQQLHGGRFRLLNERLYTTTGHQALQEMQVCAALRTGSMHADAFLYA